MVRSLFFLALCLSVAVGQAHAQTVDLATRTVWISERPKTMDVDSPFFAFLDIDWIDAILSAEPVFKGAVLQIEQEQGIDGTHSVAWSVAHLTPLEVELDPNILPPEFRIPGYKIFGVASHQKPNLV